jgi:hypothetical protein
VNLVEFMMSFFDTFILISILSSLVQCLYFCGVILRVFVSLIPDILVYM